MTRWTALLIVWVVASACPSHPVETSAEDEKLCPGGGENIELPTARELCVYRWPIVIETGFSCPAHRLNQFDVPNHFATCSSFDRPNDIELDFLYREFGVPSRDVGWVGVSNRPTSSQPAVDILWVIDNSGSMCQEQKMLRDSFGAFIEQISQQTTDFQIGVTTTDTNPDYVLEPVAMPGVLQSTPQPVVGFDRSCHMAVDGAGEVIAGDYRPIRDSIATAVDCMANPDPSYLTVSNADIECALYSEPQGCDIVGRCEGAEVCTTEDIFPPASSYRDIPSVIRAQEYLVEGELDVARLQADFACASLVGTRGYGIEKGLEAMQLAVSPALAESANRGFIREDSAFAVMFVTDEDDCSHNGTLAEDTACGGDVCAFANDGSGGSPLIGVQTVKEQLLANLSATKGRAVSENEVFAGSIHGTPLQFSGPAPTEAECGQEDYAGIVPTCATTLGIAYSGERYNEFIHQFPDGNHFPTDNGPAAWMCQGDFSPALGTLGGWLAEGVAR